MSLPGPVSKLTSDFITLSGTYFYLGPNLPMDFSGSDPFTVEGWVAFTDLESSVPLFSKAGELILGITASGNVFARRRFWENPLLSAQALEPGIWHHMGITCDEHAWTLWVNGEASAALRTANTDEIPQSLGTLDRSANLSCEIWNFRIWSVARTRQQMLAAAPSGVEPQDGLVASFFPELPAASKIRLDREIEISAA